MPKRKNQYSYGRKKEQKVARSLRSRGAKVDLSKSSKGATDLVAKFPTGTKWAVQVKSIRSGKAASPTSKELGRLKQSATKTKATPVVAKVSQNGVDYSSARSGRKLAPPPSRKR
jgi:Holliday junction resolvase-like predicted endonuclease